MKGNIMRKVTHATAVLLKPFDLEEVKSGKSVCFNPEIGPVDTLLQYVGEDAQLDGYLCFKFLNSEHASKILTTRYYYAQFRMAPDAWDDDTPLYK
jgi:hypothetical protein